MSLPPGLRRKIYSFAVVEPQPLPLKVHYPKVHHRSPTLVEPSLSPSDPRIYTVEKHYFQMMGTCHEFRAEMSALFYKENSFFFSTRQEGLRPGIRVFAVDLERIEKCHLHIDKVGLIAKGESWFNPIPKHRNLESFVATLVAKGHQLKYLLVECEAYFHEWLPESLKLLTMLKNIHLVHFRSSDANIYPFFRFLEESMMSRDRTVDFSCWDGAKGKYLPGAEFQTMQGVNKSEEQMESTARELYAILGIKGGFVPQSQLRHGFVYIPVTVPR